APAQRVSMIDRTRKAELLRLHWPCRAEHEEARHTERIAVQVTAEALEGALELWRAGRRVGALIERVEDDSRGLVMGGHLDDLAAAHPAEGHAIVEEERARIALVDQVSLDPKSGVY